MSGTETTDPVWKLSTQGPDFGAELDQLHEPAGLARGHDHVEFSGGIGEQYRGGGGVEELHAAVDQQLQQFDDVVPLDERVGEARERLQQSLLACEVGHDAASIPPGPVVKLKRPSTMSRATSIIVRDAANA